MKFYRKLFVCLFSLLTFAAVVSDLLANDTKAAPEIVLRVARLPDSGFLLHPINFSGIFAAFDCNWTAGDRFDVSLVNGGTDVPVQFVPVQSQVNGVLACRFPKSLVEKSRTQSLDNILKINWLGPKNETEKRTSALTSQPIKEYRVQSGKNVIVHRSGVEGAFPARFEFTDTKTICDFGSFFWLDRLYNSSTRGYELRQDKKAELELVSDGPVCLVLRSIARFINYKGEWPESKPSAVSHWFYFKESPFVYVNAQYRQERPAVWNELHFSEFHQKDVFSNWIGLSSDQTGAFQGKEAMPRFRNAGALLDKNGNGLALFGGSLAIYDGKNRTSSYLLNDPNFAWQIWDSLEKSNSGWFCLGTFPKSDKEKYDLLRQLAKQVESPYAQIDIPILRKKSDTWQEAAFYSLLIDGTGNDSSVGTVRKIIELYRRHSGRTALESKKTSSRQNDRTENIFPLESADLGALFSLTAGASGQELRICSLIDKQKKISFLPGDPQPIFSIVLRDMQFVEKNRLLTKQSSDKKLQSLEKTEKILDSASGWTSVKALSQTDRLVFEFTSGPEYGLTVRASFIASPSKSGIETEFEYQLDSKQYSVMEVTFPAIRIRPLGPEMTGFYPTGSGILLNQPIETKEYRDSNYPTGFGAPMSWTAVWEKGLDGGLYFAVHDPLGTPRYIRFDGRNGQWIDLNYRYTAPDRTRTGNSWKIPGRGHLQTIGADWFDAALIYRNWVRREANWYPKLGPEGREDTPIWMRRLSLWAIGGGAAPEALIEPIRNFQKAFDVPAGFHWYNWHVVPFDNDYPHFLPAKKGFKQSVLELQKNGNIFIMPYINGRLWDSKDREMQDWQFTSVALKGVSKKEDGLPYLESYSSLEKDGQKVKLGAMCPTTEVWRNKVRENVLRILNEEGTAAVYVDQVAASQTTFCMDPGHGHPLGGGAWWSNGYWQMFKVIRADMKKDLSDRPLCSELKELSKKDPDFLSKRMLTTECNMEVHAHIFDGFLTWHWQFDNSVPAFPAVYGGAIQLFGRAYAGNALAWRMKAAEEFVYGEQIGWFSTNVIKESKKFDFIKEAVLLRQKNVEYFYKGEMSRPVRLLDPIPRITEDWQWSGKEHPVTASAVRTSTWRILNYDKKQKGIEQVESAIILFSNYTEESLKSRIKFSPQELGFTGDNFVLRWIGSDGKKSAPLPHSILEQPIDFPAVSSKVLELTPKK